MNLTNDALKQKIVALMLAQPRQRFSIKDFQKRLGKQPGKTTSIQDALSQLIREGTVVRLKKSHYALAKAAHLVPGRVQAHPEGFGFLVPELKGIDDIHLSRREMRRVMHGDRVLVRIDQNKKGDREAHIVQILERAHKRIAGILGRDSRGNPIVVPMDPRISPGIRIKTGGPSGAPGEVVAAEITRYGGGYSPPEGELIRVLGEPDDPEVQAQAIIFRYGLSQDFPSETQKSAAACPRSVTAAEVRSRKDLRNLITFTIDGETARDFDDAVALEKTGETYRLYVSIADVSAYVAKGSELDREAYERGTSVYFPDRAIPMLPPELSSGICSLMPHMDRLVKTVALDINRRGEVQHAAFFDGVIHSTARLTYTEVRRILVDRDAASMEQHQKVVSSLRLMEELTHILAENRKERGSLDFDLPETEIIFDPQGLPRAIVRAERSIAHRMIEEFMIAANEAVARHLRAQRLPFLYRVHEAPDEETLEALGPFIASLGYRLPRTKDRTSPKDIQSILEACRGKPEERVLNRILLRSMSQAHYEPENIGHFGLASSCYTHFTSPIRRYPDLVVHRMLARAMTGEKLSSSERDELWGYLDEAGKHTSARERLAMDAERDMVELKKAQFMTGKIGEEFEGVITDLTSFGFFVELITHFVEGLVNLKSLEDDYYHYYENAHVIKGQRHGRTFRMGDTVRIKVARIKAFQGEIDFELVDPLP